MGAIQAVGFTDQLYHVVGRGLFRGLYLRTAPLPWSEDKTEQSYTLHNKKHEPVVSFRARPLPGCCGVLVVYYLRPSRDSKEPQKVFTDTLNLIVEAAGLAKFGSVLLTQTVDTAGSAATAAMAKPSAFFTNWKTNNRIGLFVLETKAPEAEPKKAAFDGE
jgi:hypothetical protein